MELLWSLWVGPGIAGVLCLRVTGCRIRIAGCRCLKGYLRVPLKAYYTGSLKGLIRGTVPYLGADGSVVTWGNDAYGGDSSAVQSQLKNVPHISALSSRRFCCHSG